MTVESHLERGRLPPGGIKQLFEAVAKDFEAQKKAYENIENSVLTELVVTDTIPLKHHSDKIKVVSVAPLFARAIRNVHEHGSISSLFRQVFAHQTKIELK